MAQGAKKNSKLVEALNRVGRYYVDASRSKLQSLGHHATGELANSLDFELAGQEINILTTQYGEAVDMGSSVSSRGFGKVSYRFVEDILRWATAKGIRPNSRNNTTGNMRKMAYAIARTIQKDGIIQQYGNQGAKVFDQVYAELEDRIGDDILEAYQQDVQEMLDSQINNKIVKK